MTVLPSSRGGIAVIDRRGVIKGLGLLSLAPAIVRASSLMNVNPGLQSLVRPVPKLPFKDPGRD